VGGERRGGAWPALPALLCSGVGAPRPISFSTLGRGGRGSLCFRLFAGGFHLFASPPVRSASGRDPRNIFYRFPGFSHFSPPRFPFPPCTGRPNFGAAGCDRFRACCGLCMPPLFWKPFFYQDFFGRFCRLYKLIKTVCIIDFLFPNNVYNFSRAHFFRRRVWV
jgi:hypothetical protein